MRRSRRRASLPPALPKADAADEPGEKESKEELPADGPPPARSRAARRPSLSSFAKAGGNVRVFCRLRPQNERELAAGGKIATVVADDGTSLDLLQGLAYGMEAESRLRFSFDRIFAPGAPQLEVFETVAAPVVAEVLRGINGTVFAYGQTSSGKTYTMEGPSLEDAELMGIVPRCVGALFDGIADAPATTEFTLSVSMLEIYMERIRDLLDSSRVALKVREDPSEGVVVVGLSQQGVTSPEEIFALLRTGADNRAKGATRMNKNSSRSHSIVVLHINQLDTASGSTTKGRLYLVDLAGSEKVSKTGAAGQTLAEAKTINKSLSTLGQVITALTSSRASHIPYRDSKLTRVLQESLGGNARTALVLNCSPSSYNEMETLSTLRFGSRAKRIQNRAEINKVRSPEEMARYIKQLEAQVKSLRAAAATPTAPSAVVVEETAAGGDATGDSEAKRSDDDSSSISDGGGGSGGGGGDGGAVEDSAAAAAAIAAEKEAAVAEAAAETAKAEAAAAAALASAAVAAEEAAAVSEEVKALRSQNAALQRAVESLESEVAALRAETGALTEDNLSLRQQVEQAAQDNRVLDRALAEKEADAERMLASLQAKCEMEISARIELDAAKDAIQKLTRDASGFLTRSLEKLKEEKREWLCASAVLCCCSVSRVRVCVCVCVCVCGCVCVCVCDRGAAE
eukprot:PLAT12506.11.p1 GENE.PLAT12506.11~~PLAT12506.11.p1  ORF type:complete len:686 (-),score=285.26 PLAT12506.11:8-2065(-)